MLQNQQYENKINILTERQSNSQPDQKSDTGPLRHDGVKLTVLKLFKQTNRTYYNANSREQVSLCYFTRHGND